MIKLLTLNTMKNCEFILTPCGLSFYGQRLCSIYELNNRSPSGNNRCII